jgi:hypothetical protein
MALPHPSTPFLSFDGRDLIVRLVYRDEHDESIVEVIFERALAFSQRAEPLTGASYYEDSYDKVAIRDGGLGYGRIPSGLGLRPSNPATYRTTC